MGIDHLEQTLATQTRRAHCSMPWWTEDQPCMVRGSHRSQVNHAGEPHTLPLLSLESPESQGTRMFTEEQIAKNNSPF